MFWRMIDQIKIELRNAWIEASIDLGVSIKTSFKFHLDKGHSFDCILLIEDFGSRLGTIVFTDSKWLKNEKFKSSGYGIAILEIVALCTIEVLLLTC